MHEVAEVAVLAIATTLERAAFALPKIGDGGELRLDLHARVQAALHGVEGGGGGLLVAEAHVAVAGEVLGEVLADVDALDLAVLLHLGADVVVEVVEVVAAVLVGDVGRGEALLARVLLDLLGRVVEVLQHDRLAEHGLVVDARAAVAVAARAYLVVERAVHLVLLRAVDVHEVLRHLRGIGRGTRQPVHCPRGGWRCCAKRNSCDTCHRWKWKYERHLSFLLFFPTLSRHLRLHLRRSTAYANRRAANRSTCDVPGVTWRS